MNELPKHPNFGLNTFKMKDGTHRLIYWRRGGFLDAPNPEKDVVIYVTTKGRIKVKTIEQFRKDFQIIDQPTPKGIKSV